MTYKGTSDTGYNLHLSLLYYFLLKKPVSTPIIGSPILLKYHTIWYIMIVLQYKYSLNIEKKKNIHKHLMNVLVTKETCYWRRYLKAMTMLILIYFSCFMKAFLKIICVFIYIHPFDFSRLWFWFDKEANWQNVV